MRLPLDTHTLLWWLAGDPALPPTARAALQAPGNAIFVRAASAWEIVTKYRLGKLPTAAALLADMGGIIACQGFSPLPITLSHAQAAGALPGPHRDPFDRMLVAQALAENLALVSNEEVFERYGAARLW